MAETSSIEDRTNMQDCLDRIFAGFSGEQGELIPLLQQIQAEFGYLPPEPMRQASRFLNVTESDVYGVATFYSQFRFQPPGKHHVKVCQGTACHVRGGNLVLEQVVRKLGVSPGETTDDRKFSLERVACFGSCALAPVVVIDDKVYGRLTPKKTEKLIEEVE